MILQKTNMDKYVEALGNIKDIESWEVKEIRSTITLKTYLEIIKSYKDELMDNLSISSTHIQVNEYDNERHYEGGKTLEDCFTTIAIHSLVILSKLKNITIESIISSNTKLFEKKNADYGNSFADFELIGIIVRLNDKINRILNLGEDANKKMKVDEKIEDTINDLYNYCVIGLMYT